MSSNGPFTGMPIEASYKWPIHTPSGVLAGFMDQFCYTRDVYHTTRFLVDKNGVYSFECAQFETKHQATKWVLGHNRTPQQERSQDNV